jgi:hypothetical protein
VDPKAQRLAVESGAKSVMVGIKAAGPPRGAHAMHLMSRPPLSQQ